MATRTIGYGKTYSTIAAAVAAASDGDTLEVYPELANGNSYYNASIITNLALTIVGQTARQGITLFVTGTFQAGASAANTPAAVSGTLTIKNFTIVQAGASAYCFSLSGTVVFDSCRFYSATMVQGNYTYGGTWKYINCLFEFGAGAANGHLNFGAGTYTSVSMYFYYCGFIGQLGTIKLNSSSYPSTFEMIDCYSIGKGGTSAQEYTNVDGHESANSTKNISTGTQEIGSNALVSKTVANMAFAGWPSRFDIDTTSVAYHAGDAIAGITVDMWGRSRHVSTPSIGPLEGGTMDPGEVNVRKSTTYYIAETLKTGTAYIPAATDVRKNVNVDATVGSAYIPASTDVRFGTSVDATTGSLKVPAVGNVALGVDVDAATGTRTDCPANKALANASYGNPASQITGTVALSKVTTDAGGTLSLDNVTEAAGGNYHDPENSEVKLNARVGVAPRVGTYSAAATAPSTPTLAVTDNHDGSIAAAITGDAGVTHLLKYKLASATAWSSGGSRVGDGSIAKTGLTVGARYDFFVISSDSGAYSLPSAETTITLSDGTAQSYIITLAELVKDEINANITFGGAAVTAVRDYLTFIQHKDLDALLLLVTPQSQDMSPSARRKDQQDYVIDVAVIQKVANTAAADALLKLLDEIYIYFQRFTADGYSCMAAVESPIYDAQRLQTAKEFVSKITLTFRSIK